MTKLHETCGRATFELGQVHDVLAHFELFGWDDL
jgi:hypothetical protein